MKIIKQPKLEVQPSYSIEYCCESAKKDHCNPARMPTGYINYEIGEKDLEYKFCRHCGAPVTIVNEKISRKNIEKVYKKMLEYIDDFDGHSDLPEEFNLFL